MKENVKVLSCPPIVRTRGRYLYGQDGKQYVDLWLHDGKAVLGHTIPGYLRVLKSSISRGLLAPYPSVYQGRVAKLLRGLFPSHGCITFLPSDIAAQATLSAVLGGEVSVVDPALGESSSGNVLRWRPYANCSADFVESFDAVIPVLPVVSEFFPTIILTKKVIDYGGTYPPSPLILDGFVKAIAALNREVGDPPISQSLLDTVDNLGWKRVGPYVQVPFSGDKYQLFEAHMVTSGFIVPPTPDSPLILPWNISTGFEKQLITLLEQYS